MTNKKQSALNQFVAFATNPADNGYTSGTLAIAQAFKELAERVEALEAKQHEDTLLVFKENGVHEFAERVEALEAKHIQVLQKIERSEYDTLKTIEKLRMQRLEAVETTGCITSLEAQQVSLLGSAETCATNCTNDSRTIELPHDVYSRLCEAKMCGADLEVFAMNDGRDRIECGSVTFIRAKKESQ